MARTELRESEVPPGPMVGLRFIRRSSVASKRLYQKEQVIVLEMSTWLFSILFFYSTVVSTVLERGLSGPLGVLQRLIMLGFERYIFFALQTGAMQ